MTALYLLQLFSYWLQWRLVKYLVAAFVTLRYFAIAPPPGSVRAVMQPLDLIMAAVDIKGTMKDFCSIACLSSFKSSTASTRMPPSVCGMCSKPCTVSEIGFFRNFRLIHLLVSFFQTHSFIVIFYRPSVS